jgi:hypothetical protein
VGTDAAQIMRSDLGSGKPILHYQETPVFISDFVSSVEPVSQVHSTAVTISACTDTSVTLSSDISAQISAIMGTVSASNPVYLTARTGLTGKWVKVVLKVTAVVAAVLTIDPTFRILNDEANKLSSVV